MFKAIMNIMWFICNNTFGRPIVGRKIIVTGSIDRPITLTSDEGSDS